MSEIFSCECFNGILYKTILTWILVTQVFIKNCLVPCNKNVVEVEVPFPEINGLDNNTGSCIRLGTRPTEAYTQYMSSLFPNVSNTCGVYITKVKL